MSPGRSTATLYNSAQRWPGCLQYPCHMRIDMTKATLGGAWLIALSALALSGVVITARSWALLFGMGIVPVVIMWVFWAPPEASLSQSIAKARE